MLKIFINHAGEALEDAIPIIIIIGLASQFLFGTVFNQLMINIIDGMC